MFDPVQLGRLAGEYRVKLAIKVQRARAGRTHRGQAMARELGAAGGKQNHGKAFSYPSGRSVH